MIFQSFILIRTVDSEKVKMTFSLGNHLVQDYVVDIKDKILFLSLIKQSKNDKRFIEFNHYIGKFFS
jgi:hypothetical protein